MGVGDSFVFLISGLLSFDYRSCSFPIFLLLFPELSGLTELATLLIQLASFMFQPADRLEQKMEFKVPTDFPTVFECTSGELLFGQVQCIAEGMKSSAHDGMYIYHSTYFLAVTF